MHVELLYAWLPVYQQMHSALSVSALDVRTSCPQCSELVAEGAIMATTAAELVQKCDITYAMLADPGAAVQVMNCRLRSHAALCWTVIDTVEG